MSWDIGVIIIIDHTQQISAVFIIDNQNYQLNKLRCVDTSHQKRRELFYSSTPY